MDGISASYVEGFCKAAEEAGVDPELLLKQALSVGDFGRLGRIGRGVMGAVRHPIASSKRFVELLRGGNADKMKYLRDYNNARNSLLGPMSADELVGYKTRELAEYSRKRLMGTASTGDVDKIREWVRKARMAADETRKVRNARMGAAGTGIAGTGIAGGFAAGRSSSQEQPA